MKRYYISYIKLTNYIQLHRGKPKTYEKYFDPTTRVYVFKGAVGVGKSSIVQELQPFATIHGSTTIIMGKEGEKEILYTNLDDPSESIKVRHVFVPNKKGHSVKSFLYEMRHDEVIKTVVNGSIKEFKSAVKEYLNIDNKKIKITGIGLKYNKQKMNLISCTDSERFNFVKDILNILDEVVKKEERATDKLKESNKYIQEYKAILKNISNIDFNMTEEKIKNEISQYDTEKNLLIRDKTIKEEEIKTTSGLDVNKQAEYIYELKVIRSLKEISETLTDSLIDSFRNIKEKHQTTGFDIKTITDKLIMLKSEKLSIKYDRTMNDSETIEGIDEQIERLKETTDTSITIDTDLLDESIEELNEIYRLICTLEDDLNISINDYNKYKSIDFIEEDITSRINRQKELNNFMKEISEFTVTDLEKRILSASYPNEKNCKECNLLSLRTEIESKIHNHERLYGNKTKYEAELENIQERLNLLYIIKRKYGIYENLILKIRRINQTEKHKEELGRHTSDEFKFILMFNDIYEEYKNKKYHQNNIRRIRDLELKREELLRFKDYLASVENINKQIMTDETKLNTLVEEKKAIEETRLFKVPEEIVYKYYNLNFDERIKELEEEISRLSELGDKVKNLKDDLSMITNNYGRLSELIDKKNNELIKLLTEKERYNTTNMNYENELKRNARLEKFKLIFSKKIPKILIDNYMLFVKEKANSLLFDIDRYKIHKTPIEFKNNRNLFDIIVKDYDIYKSCAHLSNGEENLINLVVTLPLLYMSTSYRILRLDEVDSFLDTALKFKFIEKILTLPFTDIYQIFVVSHSDTFDLNDNRIAIETIK